MKLNRQFCLKISITTSSNNNDNNNFSWNNNNCSEFSCVVFCIKVHLKILILLISLTPCNLHTAHTLAVHTFS